MTALDELDPDGEDLLGLPVCKKCNEVHERQGRATCKAHGAHSGKRCRAFPIPGGTVCTTHGGVTQTQGKQVQDLRRQQEMQYATSMLGLVNYDVTPEEALLQTVRESAANVAFLRARVQELVGAADLDDPTHPLIWGITQNVSTGASATPGDDETSAAGANVWYEMYMREREMLLKASTAAVRAGIAERRVRLAEMGAEVIVGRIRQILNALNLTPEQMAESDRVVPLQIAMLAQDLEAQQV
jgi:hypothetical protein